MTTSMARTYFIVFVYISVTILTLATSNHAYSRVPVSYSSTNVTFDRAGDTNGTVLQTGAKTGHSTKVRVYDMFMMGTIKLGKQPFNVIFDSGSSALWVFGSDVNKDYFINEKPPFNHNFYSEKGSETFRPQHSSSSNPEGSGLCASEKYGDGCSTEGTVGFEELTVGDIVVPHTRFQITKKLKGPSSQFTGYDGIFGLGLAPRVSGEDTLVSPFVGMVENGELDLKMFSVYLGPDGSSMGEIMFGGYDRRRFNKPVEMINVMPHPRKKKHTDWIVRVSKFRIGVIGVRSKTLPFYALIDTGTNTIVLPGPMVQSLPRDDPSLQPLLDALDSAREGYLTLVACASRHTLPILRFSIGSRIYSLKGEEYTGAPGGAKSIIRDGVEYCASAKNGRRQHEEFILGAPFLRKYHAMFYYDYENSGKPMIGLAAAKHGGLARDNIDDNNKQESNDEEGYYFPQSFACGAWCDGPLFQIFDDEE